MVSTKLNLGEIYILSQELVGNENFKGLLSQPLSLKTKYWLQRLSDKVNSEVKTIDEMRNNLIKELGEEKDGQISIPAGSPNIEKFSVQFGELMSEEKEISHAEFKIEQFENLETAEHYAVFLKLITFEE